MEFSRSIHTCLCFRKSSLWIAIAENVQVHCVLCMYPTMCMCSCGCSKLSSMVRISGMLIGLSRQTVCVCACMCTRVCLCICRHPFPAGFPVQSPQSDTADDGCAAVICFIRLGVSLASSTIAQPSTYLSEKGESPIYTPKSTHYRLKLYLFSFMQKTTWEICFLNRAAGPGQNRGGPNIKKPQTFNLCKSRGRKSSKKV